MPEIQLILSAKRIPITYDAFETCWFLDLKYGNRLTDITNGSYDHCLEQKRHWQSVIDRGEIEALIPSCRPPLSTEPKNTMSIDLTHITSIRNETLPVYLKYEGQSKPQPAHVELTEDGVVTAGANPEIGNAVTMDVWHRRTMRWPIDPGLTGAQIADAIQDALPLLERVHAGHSVEFDGSNMGGLLTEDAAEASAKLGGLLEKIHSEVNVYSAAEYAGRFLA